MRVTWSGMLPAGRGGSLAASSVRRRAARVVLAGVAFVAAAGLLTGAGLLGHADAQARSGGGWGKAEKVPGLAAIFKNGHWTAAIKSLSCASPGNCTAAGYYKATPRGDQALKYARAFVVSQKNGRWGRVVTVPGVTALGTGGDAEISSVSCTRGGCAAGGYYDGTRGARARRSW